MYLIIRNSNKDNKSVMLYLGNLNYSTNETYIKNKLGEVIDNILEVRLIKNNFNESKGYGFVSVGNKEDADKLIREFDKDITIFALTAVTIEDKMHEFDEAGFTDIIPKPFKQEDFEKKLYNALIGEKTESA